MKSFTEIRNLVISAVFSLTLLSCTTSKKVEIPPAPPPVDPFKVNQSHVQIGSQIALASDGKHAAQIAKDIHAAGGNWADVFVATSFALAVEKPQSTGIGGGGFALIYVAKEKKTYAYDFREAAPARLIKKYKDLLDKDGKRIPELSSKSVKGSGVPGTVIALEKIHKRWGKLKWNQVIEPAIQLAHQGFEVDSLLEQAIQLAEAKLRNDPEMSALYFNNSLPIKAGELLIQKDLASSLKAIAKKGSSEFYRGPLSKKIIKFNRDSGGYFRERDFIRYKVIDRKPLEVQYGVNKLQSFPFPSFGGEATLMIQNTPEIQSKKPDLELIKNWVTTVEGVFDARAKKYEATPDKPQTTHISLIDGEGNAISSTQTVNSTFGSGKMVPGTGIVLNDEMDDFYFENPKALNHPKNNARPLSSMSPVLLFKEDKIALATGSQGGRRIISCVNWVLSNFLWQEKSLEDSVSSPRLHPNYPKKELVADKNISPEWSAALSEYTITHPPVDCRVQSVERTLTTGILKSVVDPRSTGVPFAL